MLKLTRQLFSAEPKVTFADYYERALYNTILASQDPDSGMMTYFQSTRPGYLKLYCTPFDSFWCCTGTGMENHAKYGDSIYFHGENGKSDSVFVNLFIPSTLKWKEKGIELKQTTEFPEVETTRLEITAAAPVSVKLNIRHPGWCAAVRVRVNGESAANSSAPGTFIAIDRTWNSGDIVEVELPMTLRTELLPGSTGYAAIAYGPIVLVARLARRESRPGPIYTSMSEQLVKC